MFVFLSIREKIISGQFFSVVKSSNFNLLLYGPIIDVSTMSQSLDIIGIV